MATDSANETEVSNSHPLVGQRYKAARKATRQAAEARLQAAKVEKDRLARGEAPAACPPKHLPDHTGRIVDLPGTEDGPPDSSVHMVEIEDPPTSSVYTPTALESRGFPADWWAGWEVAHQWQGDDFPLHPTAESVGQWRALVTRAAECAAARSPKSQRDQALCDSLLAQRDHNEALLRQHAPGAFVVAAGATVPEPGQPRQLPTAGQPPAPRPDGPEGGRWLWWQGERCDVPTGNVYRLLAFMWSRHGAHYDDLIGSNAVFADSVDTKTVQSTVSKLEKVIAPAGVSWRLHCNAPDRFLTKEDRLRSSQDPQGGS